MQAIKLSDINKNITVEKNIIHQKLLKIAGSSLKNSLLDEDINQLYKFCSGTLSIINCNSTVKKLLQECELDKDLTSFGHYQAINSFAEIYGSNIESFKSIIGKWQQQIINNYDCSWKTGKMPYIKYYFNANKILLQTAKEEKRSRNENQGLLRQGQTFKNNNRIIHFGPPEPDPQYRKTISQIRNLNCKSFIIPLIKQHEPEHHVQTKIFGIKNLKIVQNQININILKELAADLDILHQSGFAHGDVNNTNIIVKIDTNEVYLVDWTESVDKSGDLDYYRLKDREDFINIIIEILENKNNHELIDKLNEFKTNNITLTGMLDKILTAF